MHKLKLYTFSFVCFLVFALSINKSFMGWWSEYRTSRLKILPTRVLYGDLYSVCYLSGFIDTSHTRLKTYKQEGKKIDLYILHDSYLFGRIEKENFKNLNKLILSDFRGEGISIKPDLTKKNILIIECSERSASWRFIETATLFSKLKIGSLLAPNKKTTSENNTFSKYFFNPLINQNIEFNLFDYSLFMPLKEVKANLNYILFNKTQKGIALSTDKKYLLLSETTEADLGPSSFKYIANEEIGLVATNLNLINKYYTSKGFNEIYFSIIPNPVSIIDAERLPYNHKIERIQTNSFLKTNYIDIYGVFKDTKKQVYRKDDSHWNNYGLQLWIDEVNTKILEH